MSEIITGYIDKEKAIFDEKMFKCVGHTQCLNSCCQHTNFTAGSNDLEKIFLSDDCEVKALATLTFGIDKGQSNLRIGDTVFFRSNPNNQSCWFLQNNGECLIHTKKVKPKSCVEYPFIKSHQQLLSFSCPEVSKEIFKDASYSQYLKRSIKNQTPKSFRDEIKKIFLNLIENEESTQDAIKKIVFICYILENTPQERIEQTIKDIEVLIQLQDDSLRLGDIQFDDVGHALLLNQLLKMRKTQRLSDKKYKKVISDVKECFEWPNQDMNFDEKAGNSINLIKSGFQFLFLKLKSKPFFLKRMAINHFLFVDKSETLEIKELVIRFVFSFLLIRLFLVSQAMVSANNFEDNASMAISVFYREWMDEPTMFESAVSTLKESRFGDLLSIIRLV